MQPSRERIAENICCRPEGPPHFLRELSAIARAALMLLRDAIATARSAPILKAIPPEYFPFQENSIPLSSKTTHSARTVSKAAGSRGRRKSVPVLCRASRGGRGACPVESDPTALLTAELHAAARQGNSKPP